MFTSIFCHTSSLGAGMSAIVASVSSALAYATALDEASIVVSQNGSSLVLDGTAPNLEVRESAAELARSITSYPVQNRIALAS